MIPIIRRIDDLGRIVIPKDIRKDLRIFKEDLLKLEVKNDYIIISKNKETDEYIKLCNTILNNLYKLLKNNIIITNNNIILECKGDIKNKGEKITDEIVNKILNRKPEEKKELLFITHNLSINKNYLFEPIIINSSVIGSIIYYKEDKITENEKILIELSKSILENYIEEVY